MNADADQGALIRGPLSDPVRISIVMPVHNAERYVEAAIRSVLASDLSELELVAVDDGSTDRSLEVLRAILDPRLVLIKQNPSGGPSRPRNVGIRQARGAYVALLDADDLIKPDKLSRAVAAMDENPGAALAFGNYERIDAEGRVLEHSTLSAYPVFAQLERQCMADGWQRISQADFARGLLYENFIGTSGVTLRTTALERVGLFDEELTYSEDRDLWFRLAHLGDALYSDAVGHSYRVFPGSLTFRPGSRQALQRITVLERERLRWSTPTELDQIDRLLAENLEALAYAQRKNGQRFASATSFLRAFRKAPQPRFLRSALNSLVPMPGSKS
jgi:glycosyltransferase involved in cell wall biosynthesis